MAKVIFGNHLSVLVPRQDRDNIRKFYCDVLGGKIMKVDPERDFVHLLSRQRPRVRVPSSSPFIPKQLGGFH
jgi:hypothetical protein